VNITCQQNTPPGRYLIIQLPIANFLTLCEVKVYASAQGDNIGANVQSLPSIATSTTTQSPLAPISDTGTQFNMLNYNKKISKKTILLIEITLIFNLIQILNYFQIISHIYKICL